MARSESLPRLVSELFSTQHCDKDGAVDYSIKMTKGKCLYCGEKLINVDSDGNKISIIKKFHRDHIYPASRLNLFDVGNIAISCETCNVKKKNSFPLYYYRLRKKNNEKVLFENEEKFSIFLDEMTKPYQEKWQKQYEFNFEKNPNKKIKEMIIDLLTDLKLEVSKEYKPLSNIDNCINTLTIKENFLNRPLTTEDKSLLLKDLNIKDKNDNIIKWPTLKKVLLSLDYKVKDTTLRINRERRRVSIISLNEDLK